jgi:hypothetical protein
MSETEKTSFIAADARKPMVGWYDPMQLLRTAFDVLFSTLFGRHADFRAIEALGTPNIDPKDYDYTDFVLFAPSNIFSRRPYRSESGRGRAADAPSACSG